MKLLSHASVLIGILGMIVILRGVVGGLMEWLRAEIGAFRGRPADGDRRRLRPNLGYYIRLGLAFLSAADILDSLVQPGIPELIRLGTVVVLRTIISVSLNFELNRKDVAPVDDSIPISGTLSSSKAPRHSMSPAA
jgi:uncharacterized membrane protein